MSSRASQSGPRKPQLEELESRYVPTVTGLETISSAITIEQSSTTQSVAVQQSMGTYLQVAGAIPPATSSAWFTWYDTLKNARLEYSMQTRSQAFFFSSTGDDATGDGSQALPWQSLSKARAMLTQTGGDVALLFKRGDEFYDTVGLTVTQPFVTIGAWGDTNLPKPMLSAFTINYSANSNAWTQLAGTNSWTASAPSLIGWIRDASNDIARLSPFTYLQTASAVSNNLRSWTWVSGTLYLNPGAGIDPNTINWEAVGNVNQDGVAMSGNGGLITDIRADGWGCVATQQYESWGIKVNPADSSSVVAMNTESYYNGRHGASTHSLLPTSRGGFSVLLNNVSGYTTGTVAQSTIFNIFSPSGGNEAISEGNTARFGRLPDYNLIGGGLDTVTPAFFGHTGGRSGQTVSLVINRNSRVIRETYAGATYTSGINSFNSTALPGSDSDLSSLRNFVVNFQNLTGQPYTISALTKTVQMNNLYQMSGALPLQSLTDANGGWYINCIWAISDPTMMERYFVNAYSKSPVMHIVYNTFLLDGSSNAPYQAWDFVVNSGTNNRSVFTANNIIARTGIRGLNLGVINDGQHLLANAYYQITDPATYSGDIYSTTLATMPAFLTAPTLGSSLIGGAIADTYGYTVDYDFYGHSRNILAPTQGAIEFDWTSIPMTDAGQYYIVQAGHSLAFEARNARSDATYSWDLNGDSVYGDAIGANPVLTWSQLLALGIRNGSYNVRLQTIVDSTVTYSDPAYLMAIDRAPYANAGSAQSINQGVVLNLDASQSIPFTHGESLNYSWDINGDGVFGDATGVKPTLNYVQLAALGLRGGNHYDVRVLVSQAFDSTTYRISNPVLLTYKYVPVVAKAGGPYTISEGQSLVLNGSGSSDPLGMALSYAWDVNGDGIYGEAIGVSPTLSWAQLQGLGITDGVSTRNIKVQVSDGYGRTTTSASSLLTVNNTAPVASIVRIDPTGDVVRGDTVTYILSATDASAADQSANFTFRIDWNNDNVVDQTIVALSGTTITHVWDSIGTSTIRVSATDKDGGVSTGSTFAQPVVEYALRANGTVTDLIWGGSIGADYYTFSQEAPGSYHLFQFDPLSENPMAVYIDVAIVSNVTGTLRINGGSGDDALVLWAVTNAVVQGGDGNDAFASIYQSGGTVSFIGGNGNDQFWSNLGDNATENFTGGDGDDFVIYLNGSNVTGTIDLGNGNDLAAVVSADPTIRLNILGGDGDDFIIGGVGADTIDGGSGDDFILGDFDTLNSGGGADSILGGDGNDVIIAGGGPDSINGGLGQDLLISGRIPILTYIPQGDPIPDYRGYQQVWDIWRNGDSLVDRQMELQGTVPSILESPYYLIPGTTMLEDDSVDSVLGGDDGDWLVYDELEDISDYDVNIDRKTNI